MVVTLSTCKILLKTQLALFTPEVLSKRGEAPAEVHCKCVYRGNGEWQHRIAKLGSVYYAS